MPSGQSLRIDQRIGLRLSQQQLRFVKLLEFNVPELEDAVDRELEDNPALTTDDSNEKEEIRQQPSFPGSSANSRPHTAEQTEFIVREAPETLYEHLRAQLAERNLQPIIHATAEYLIDSLDSNGYLRRPLGNIIDDMAFGPGLEITKEQADEALKVVKSLEPYGVGASDLKECLLLQLQHIPPSQERDDAINILTHAYQAFVMKHKHKIISTLKISSERVDEGMALIRSLNPKPGASFSSAHEDAANVIIPDFIVNVEDGRISISLNSSIPELKISRSFEEAMANLERTASGRAKKGSEFIVSRFNDARDFIRILKQRQETMMAVMTAIVNIQKDYFLTEDVYRLKPMMIKNIAAITGLDISVISRATANKFVATSWGIFPLRFFFSDTVGKTDNNTDVATNRKIEAEIKELVEKEDKRHPLSDQRIMEVMAERGFEISRRTVAKYRDRIGIPVARLRKNL